MGVCSQYPYKVFPVGELLWRCLFLLRRSSSTRVGQGFTPGTWSYKGRLMGEQSELTRANVLAHKKSDNTQTL